MHILIIPSWYPTDSGDIRGSFFREQAIALRKNDCKVGVIYPQLRSLRAWRSIFSGKRGIDDGNDEGVATYRSHGVNWFPRLPAGIRQLWLRHGLTLFHQYVKAHGKPDVMHVHSMLNAGVLASEVNRLHGIPFVVTEHSTSFARGLVSDSDLAIARCVARRAAKRFAVSPEFAALLNENLADQDSDWAVIPNVVNQAFLSFPLLARRGGEEFKFINVGLMDDKKKQKNIIQAFSREFGKNKNVSCTIGGDGPEMAELKQLAAALDVSDQIHFPGILSRQQVLEEIAAADVFVLSSRYETFGVVVIEALALGKPVVATRCGGPESIVRRQDGVLVPVDDVASLAAAMQFIYQHHHEYDGAEIRMACAARYGEQAIARQLMEIYLDVSAKN